MKNIFKLTKADWKGYWNVTKVSMIVSLLLGVIFIGVIWFIPDGDKDEKEEDPE